ncbi:hypothetical protein F5B18DRAFT_638723 [Nemania serpens]|nr:hypothetical protein F5B18DRAFT_638723 [Nemania serpens]
MVRHYAFHFSPWIALGLPYGSAPTAEERQSAFKRAALRCHPDRRRLAGITANRWPTIDHLKASLEYFKDLESGGVLSTLYPPNHFADFPTTFHPQNSLDDGDVYTEASLPGFFTCTVCYMVIKAAFKDEHLISHDLSTCRFCNETISTCELLEHYCQQHDINQSNIESLLAYIQQHHTCAYCHHCCADIQAHVNSEHCCDCRPENEAWEKHIATHHTCCYTYHHDLTQHFLENHSCRCRDFKDDNDFANHVTDEHICPHCGRYGADLAEHISLNHFCRHCNEAHTDLPLHVESEHKCSYCLDLTVNLKSHVQKTHSCHTCNEAYSDLDDHVRSAHFCEKCGTTHTNIRSHLRKHCNKCDFITQNPGIDLVKHIFRTHGFTVCDNCNFTPGNKYILEHINKSHSYVSCPLCEVSIDDHYINYHLVQSHGWERCKSCPATISVDAKDHLATFHAALLCKYCPQKLSERAMKDHLLNLHNGKQCPYCGEVDQETPLDNHIQQIHQPRKCLLCNGEFPASDLLVHSQQAHSAMLCTYCSFFGAESDVEQHITQNHVRCEECTGRYSKSQLRTHRQEVHSWEDCSDCEVQCAPSQLAEHKKVHDLQQCPFPSCSGFPSSADTLATHIHRKHSVSSCPFCGARVEGLDAHISDHLSKYGPNEPCPDCGKKCEEVCFLAHVLTHRVRPFHNSGEMTRPKEAGKGPTPEQFEELLKKFLVHCQGQAAPWLSMQQQHEPVQINAIPEAASHADGKKPETSKSCAKTAICDICKQERDKSNLARHRKSCKALVNESSDGSPPSKRRRI